MKQGYLALVVAVVLTLPGIGHAGGTAEAPDGPAALNLQGVAWDELRYHAANWAVDLTAAIKLAALPAAEAKSDLLESDQGTPFIASGPAILKLSLEMAMDIALKPDVTIINDVWFDPVDAKPLGRFRLRRGQDAFAKTYRFTHQGVQRHNREPRDEAEARLAPPQWTDTGRNFYPYDLARLGCPGVTERLLLIWVVSAAAEFDANQTLTFCVFGKRQLHRVELRPDGNQAVAVDFVEIKASSEKRRRGRVMAHKIRLVSTPLASDLDAPENFSFMGLHRNIEIFIDPVSRLPLQISGAMSNVASGHLKLTTARLK